MDAYPISLMQYLAAQSWQIAVVTVAVTGVTYALRHRSAHVRYLLWLIVIAKCLVPPLHVVSLGVLPPLPLGAVISAVASQQQQAGAPSAYTIPAMSGTPNLPPWESAPLPPVAGMQKSWLPAYRCLGLFWIAGVVIHLAVNLLRAWRGHRWLQKARRPFPVDEQVNAADLLQAYGARPLPRVWMLDDVGQPFVWGLFRGSIYVPAGFHTMESPQQRRDILAHEISHVVRYDAAVNTFQIVAQALFWFHPLVWWANRRIRQEREKCCDEMVVAHLDTTPKDYSRAIIETLARTREPAQPTPSLAVASPLKHIQERIKTMLRPGKRFYRRPSVIVTIFVILLTLLVTPTAVLLTGRPMHLVSGTIRIAPTTVSLLDPEPALFDRTAYEVFMQTQAVLISTDTSLLQRVIDDLVRRNLAFFSSAQPSPARNGRPQLPDGILRQAIAGGIIKTALIPNTELLEVTMATENSEEAKIIVNSFLRNYVAAYGMEENSRMSEEITILERQRREILTKITEIRLRIRATANEGGATEDSPTPAGRGDAPIRPASMNTVDQPIELRLNEELYERISRRLQEMEMQRNRSPRVQIAALAEVKGPVDNRMQWPLVLLGAVIVLSGLLLLVWLALRPQAQTVGSIDHT